MMIYSQLVYISCGISYSSSLRIPLVIPIPVLPFPLFPYFPPTQTNRCSHRNTKLRASFKKMRRRIKTTRNQLPTWAFPFCAIKTGSEIRSLFYSVGGLPYMPVLPSTDPNELCNSHMSLTPTHTPLHQSISPLLLSLLGCLLASSSPPDFFLSPYSRPSHSPTKSTLATADRTSLRVWPSATACCPILSR